MGEKINVKPVFWFVLFVVLNFVALGFGSWLMNSGPTSEWYNSLNKAPWTPPGWVFGVAWTSIMVCYSFYMARLVSLKNNDRIWILYSAQWGLNVFWNWCFFNQHLVLFAAINLFLLTAVVFYFMVKFMYTMKLFTLLVVPYFVWLLIANSLNIYFLFAN